MHQIDPHAEEQAPAPSPERVHQREDGTLVINILAQPDCATSSDDEIVVCADREGEETPVQTEAADNTGTVMEIQLAPGLSARGRGEKGLEGVSRIMIDLVLKF